MNSSIPNKKQNASTKREFRKAIAKLKKAGIVPKKVDARSVNQTRHYKSLIKEFKSVVEGTARTAKVGANQITAYQEAGYQTKGQRVVVPVAPGEKINVSHGKLSITRNLTNIKTGEAVKFKRVIFPIPFKNLKSYLENIAQDSSLNSMIDKNHKFAFKFYGNNSRQAFDNVEDMIEYIQRYETIGEAEANTAPGGYEERDIYQNLEFWIIAKANRMDWEGPREARREEYRKETNRKKAAAKRKRERKAVEAAQKKREQNRIRQQRARDRKKK
jgi:hypothetical protein